jgi:hypothetical protein
MAEPLIGSIGVPLPKNDPLNDLILPSGTIVRFAPDGALRTELGNLGIRNAHTRPRNEIVQDYWQMMRRIADDAGSKAVAEWLAQHRGQ